METFILVDGVCNAPLSVCIKLVTEAKALGNGKVVVLASMEGTIDPTDVSCVDAMSNLIAQTRSLHLVGVHSSVKVSIGESLVKAVKVDRINDCHGLVLLSSFQ